MPAPVVIIGGILAGGAAVKAVVELLKFFRGDASPTTSKDALDNICDTICEKTLQGISDYYSK